MSNTSIYLIRFVFSLALVVITYLATTSTVYPLVENLPDKLNHLMAFLLLALLLDYSVPRVDFVWWKIAALLLYGISLELIQYTLPDRFFSVWDIAADASGLAIYKLLYPWILRVPLLAKRG